MSIREEKNRTPLWISLIIAGILILVVILLFGIPAWGRYQAVQEAQNKVHVNNIVIQQTQQLIEVENKKAEIKIAEAKGIAQAQNIINATLTDRYLQHEAIMAQEKMAGSPNHTTIYIPSGQNGIPFVKTLDDNAK